MSHPKNTRKCIVCKEHSDKSEMLRFVKTADGKVALDRTQKADGRGVWVHDRADCKAKVCKKKMLNSAFKTNVSDDIYDKIND